MKYIIISIFFIVSLNLWSQDTKLSWYSEGIIYGSNTSSNGHLISAPGQALAGYAPYYKSGYLVNQKIALSVPVYELGNLDEEVFITSNPADSYLIIKFKQIAGSEVQISIYDITGKMISREEFFPSSDDYETKWDWQAGASTLPSSGFYACHIVLSKASGHYYRFFSLVLNK